MEVNVIVGYFKGKSILITGSTGFLAKILVEKILRVQPDVKKLFLLVRESNITSAKQRIQEVIGKEIFKVLKEKHGKSYHAFIEEKISPIAGDLTHENLGIPDSDHLKELWKEIDIVVNVAATTSFYERYDVALDVNVYGAKHVLEFAQRCVNLEMFLHVSTAYVAGEQEGLILEKSFKIGETLKENSCLDIEAELRLVKDRKRELHVDESPENDEKKAMKELGMERARNFGWPNTYVFTKAMGEMLLGHLRGDTPLVIMRPTIITSICNDPLPGWMEGTRTIDSLIVGYAEGKLSCFLGDSTSTMDVVLNMVNVVFFQLFSRHCNELNRKYNFAMHLAELYAPYAFFKGRFDDSNMERLRAAIMKDNEENHIFDFDPKSIDWNDYFYNTHIPGVLKYVFNK